MPAAPVRTDLKLTEIPLQFPAIFPTQGYITRGYDPRISHYGLDIAGKTGSLVFAAAEGVVLFAGWTSEDGNSIIIAHSGGFITCYKHNKAILKAAGTRVKRGKLLQHWEIPVKQAGGRICILKYGRMEGLSIRQCFLSITISEVYRDIKT